MSNIYIFLYIFAGKSDDGERPGQLFIFTIPEVDTIGLSSSLVMITTFSRLLVSVTLSIPGFSIEMNMRIDRNNHFNISLPSEIRLKQGEVKQNKTVIIESSGVVSVYVIENDKDIGDGFAVYPSSQIGKRYYIAAYIPTFPMVPSFVCATALEHTMITFTPKSGQSQSVRLNRYESFRFEGNTSQDISGMFIQSDSPITIISGVRAKVPSTRCCVGSLLEQLLPVNKWKKNYFLASFRNLDGFIYRIYSSELSTSVNISSSRDPTEYVQLGAEEFHEGHVKGDVVLSITSEEAVMVVQYMQGFSATSNLTGNPAMIVAQSLTSSSITFPVFNIRTLIRSRIYYYISVIIECSQVKGLQYSKPILTEDRLTATDKSICCVRGSVSPGQYSVYHIDRNVVFSVSVYAFGEIATAGSYAYNAYTTNEGGVSSGEYSEPNTWHA